MTSGICTNLPSACSKAAAREPIPMPTPDTSCPECGFPLKRLDGRGATGGTGSGGSSRVPFFVAGGGALAVALIAILAWVIFSHSPKHPDGTDSGTSTVDGYMLRLAGSNTIGSKLGPALVKAWLQSKGATDVTVAVRNGAPESTVFGTLNGNKVQVEIRAHGSDTAFIDMANGSAEIGMASRKIKPEEAASLASLGDMTSNASEHTIGMDGIAVIVPATNTVSQISMDDLQRLFAGDTTDWTTLGGPQQQVHLYARDDKSGTYDTFKSLVLRGRPLGQARRFEDSAQLEAAVAADPGGIGFVGMPYVKTTRALAVHDGAAAALLPTVFSVRTESYPLSRRLYFYTPSTPRNTNVSDFIAFAVSDAGQQVVKAEQFVGLSDIDQQPPKPADRGPCQFSGEYRGDPNTYCQLRNSTQQLEVTFHFRTNSFDLDTLASDDLRRLLKLMESHRNDEIILAGFADSQGSYVHNCKLSGARADAVASAIRELGLKVTRSVGFCSEAPVRSDATPDGLSKNRRVEVFLAPASAASIDAALR
jgi:phosphate transport system substrate-binding protein